MSKQKYKRGKMLESQEEESVYIDAETKNNFSKEIVEMKKESQRIKNRQTKPIKHYQTK